MEETKTELQLIKLSDIQSQEVSWLWFPFIPYGKLTIIQGDPGDGKTTFILNIAAKLSKGESLDSGMNFTEPLNVIYQSAEDGLADTVKPRLEKDGQLAAEIKDRNRRLRSRWNDKRCGAWRLLCPIFIVADIGKKCYNRKHDLRYGR